MRICRSTLIPRDKYVLGGEGKLGCWVAWLPATCGGGVSLLDWSSVGWDFACWNASLVCIPPFCSRPGAAAGRVGWWLVSGSSAVVFIRMSGRSLNRDIVNTAVSSNAEEGGVCVFLC